jgi:hypothetical protein
MRAKGVCPRVRDQPAVTGRYWVRLKDHLNAETIKSLTGVLSSYALSLKQGPSDREFTVELMPKKNTRGI